MFHSKFSFGLLLASLLFPFALQAQAPVAAFSADTMIGCAPFPLVVNFQDQSTNTPTSWLWTFGDANGSSSTLQNPAFVYSTPGCYTVSLTATNASGSNTSTQSCFIEIFAQPLPDFTVDFPIGCAPLTVNFTDISVANAAGIVDWTWTLTSNNIPLTGPNPSFSFPTTDTTGVILTVTNTNGCQNTIVVPDVVQVLAPSQADFSADVTFSCNPPLTVNFTNNSQVNAAQNVQYNWSFPGGTVAGGGNTFTGTTPPPVTYNADGQYDVTLIVSSSNSCNDTLTLTDLIGIGGVTADFSVSATQVCVGDVVTFTSLSTGGITNLEWEVDGNPGVDGTTPTFNFTYATPGTYSITLAANNPVCGDTITRTNFITVVGSPISDFTVDRTVDCQDGLPFTFTDQSTGVTTWAWDFGDATPISNAQNPVHTFPGFGTFNVCLTVTNASNCTDVFCQSITIEAPVGNFSTNPDEGCVPLNVNFQDNSVSASDPIVSWQWDFGSAANATPPTSNAQNPSTTYNAPGLFDVTLIIVTQGGCTDTVFRNNIIEVGLPPQVDFTSSKDTVCINEDITFSSTFTDPDWQYFWDFQYEDPGNFSANADTATTTYADTGYFAVALVILNQGCRDTLVIDSMVYVNPPDARFFPSDIAVCFPPQTISFADSSIGPVDVYEWYINGNLYSNQGTPPDFTIPSVGDYLITQVVKDTSAMCSDTATVVVSAGGPVADFTGNNLAGCRPNLVTFQNNSQNFSFASWTFDLDNGGPNSSSIGPIFTYQDTGSYTVRLQVADNLGCRDTMIISDYIEVYGTYPNFGVSPNGGCPPLAVTFSDSTITSSLSTAVSWSWDFGDGSPVSNVQNPTHVYISAGAFDVTLAVTDNQGCSDTITIPSAVIVTQPLVDFVVDDDTTCAGNDLTFTSTTVGVGPLTYLWDFGDGGTDTNAVAIHAYADTGSYHVSLIVTDVNGCSDTLLRNDFIYIEFFQAGFSGTPRIGVCPPLTTVFTDTTIGNVGAWQWDFGTGINFSNIQNPQNVYFTPGTFDVSLIATHIDGCRDTVSVQDYIQLNGPYGSFVVQPPNACLGDTVCVEAILTDTDVALVDWKDGNTAVFGALSGVQDTVTSCLVYNNPGKYFPEMVLTDNNGCQTTISSPDSTQIYVLPQAQISPLDSTGCLPFQVPFVDTSIPGDSVINNWTWIFGDGDSAFIQDPIHTFTLDSTFTITLAVEDINGCVDTATTSLISYEGTIGDFTASDTTGCAPFAVTFNDGSSNLPPISYTWIFGDGDTLIGPSNPTHTYTNDGTFDVTLIVSDNLGCSDTVVKQQYIVLNHPTAIVYADTVFGCNPVNLTFFADSTVLDSNRTIVQYEWCLVNINTGGVVCNTSTVDSLVESFTIGGDYAMILTVTDSEGCSDVSDSLTVTINTRVTPDPIEMRNVTVVDDNSAEILWGAYPGNDFVEYAVYRTSGPGAPLLIATITDQLAVTYLDSDPSLNFRDQSYCYKVLVQNNCLEYSLLNLTEEHCTIDLEVDSGTDALILNWSAYVGYPVSTYEIYRANDYDPANITQIGAVPGNVLTYTDLETFCSDSIGYRIRAIGTDVDERSFSDLDANAPFHPLPTESSHILTTTVVMDTFIDVSWTDYGGYRPSEYYLERSIDGITRDSLTTTPLTETSYQDNDVAVNEMSYYYRVFALDECGDISILGRLGKSILLSAAIDPSGKVPVLIWSEYEEWLNGVRNYQIEIFNDQTGAWEVVGQTGAGTRNFEDEVSTLFQSTYCYRIRAFETGNFAQEAVSNEVCVTFGPVVFTPNAFTPNNDGRNDEFRVFAPNARVGELTIYNRWGEVLFRSADLTQGWDGTYKGSPVAEGVYVFVVTGVGEDNTEFNRTGTVTLYR
ncbi:MAG: PKD domain-containing protein [Bacteroidia bacterium]